MSFFKKKRNGWHIIYSGLGIKFKIKAKPEKISELNLIFDKKAGLGNRINGFINALNYYNPDVINFYWENKGWVSSKFKDLFELKCGTELNEYDSLEQLDYNLPTIYNPPCFLKNRDGKFLSMQYNNLDKDSLNELVPFFERLLPSDKVMQRIKDFNYSGEFASLQIRNNPDWEEYGRNEPLIMFFEAIESKKNTMFYLSAMNAEISQVIRKKYPDRILELPDKNYTSMIDAAADLYILKRGRNAVYSYGSTFSDLAWWLSGGEQKVLIIGDENHWTK